ncbi:NtaA/DmoA family FMN-dependent monooxygenase [Ancylobacter polymorphus]|uniref:FMN-dependent oxidoreductase (Nitrilotriacetate monooxygenase family) n=1 Tax=Ancylobacter polymorphus TaxID=223390 RepID=A0ABU0BCD4_9HYPH|nr:NtaA/DmoA family FMN-dependent monooxygenase [Ancylobacter polymorphus]MDQ0302981.1 FMN-dependent oxidoreductase (nitrilotriacetate monooxygenase family) [Ancylobacter polymorphus]
MAPRPLHLGWFTNFAVDEWTKPFTGGGGDPWDGGFYIDMAKAMERACFDYIMLEDTLMISEAYGGSNAVYLKHNIMGPKADPSPMAALIGANTTHLGVVATFSTMAYPPFMLARLCSTLDSICKGRFGWNIVTTGEDLAAENFGMDKLPPRQERYDMADEYVELVKQLWGSWEADAVVRDRATGTYADASKVRPIHFEGKYFKSRGPLNCVPSPQQRPAFVQAGGSPRGRQFAAMTADSIIAPSMGVAGLKAYRDDVRARAQAGGRDPDEIKVLFVVAPILGETEEEAKAKAARIIEAPDYCEKALAMIAAITDIDFSKFDLDAPLPHLTTNGEQGSLDAFQQAGSGKTLRQLCADQLSRGLDGLIGTPDQVAERMGEVMAEVGGDGFLITRPFTANISRQYITDICEGLVPALQRRGLARTSYTEGATLRQMLREF